MNQAVNEKIPKHFLPMNLNVKYEWEQQKNKIIQLPPIEMNFFLGPIYCIKNYCGQ